jgi:hypothetical protein
MKIPRSSSSRIENRTRDQKSEIRAVLAVAVQLVGEIGDYRLAARRVKVATEIGCWVNFFASARPCRVVSRTAEVRR